MKNSSVSTLLALLKREPLNLASLDPVILLKTARFHGLTVMAQRALVESLAPDNFLKPFKLQTQNIQYCALLQMQALLDLHKLLKQHAIPVIFIKGPFLSHRLYNDIAVRESIDIDVLIAPQDLPTVDALLCAEGYTLVYPPRFNTRYHKQTLGTYKDFTYEHSKYAITLELHWRLDNNLHIFNPGFEQLWSAHRTVPFMQEQFYILSPEDEWLYLCAHGSRSAWRHLKWLYDVAHYANTVPLNAELLIDKINQYRIQKHCDFACSMITQYFPSQTIPYKTAQRPFYFLRKTAIRHIEMCAPRFTIKTRLRIELYRWLLLPGIKSRIHHLYSPLCKQFLKDQKSSNLQPYLFWLCSPIYSFVLMYKMIRKLSVNTRHSAKN